MSILKQEVWSLIWTTIIGLHTLVQTKLIPACVCVYLRWRRSRDRKLSVCVCYLFSQNIQNKPTNRIVRERRHVLRRVMWSTRHSPASSHQNKSPVCSRQSHSACRSTKSSAIKDFTWLINHHWRKRRTSVWLFSTAGTESNEASSLMLLFPLIINTTITTPVWSSTPSFNMLAC